MKPSAGIPEISPGMHRWFAWYSRRYIARHFNALRLLKSAPPPAADDTPAVYFFNHPSWWDPLVAISLAERFYPNQRAYGPIDAAAVEKYPFMKRLGFFPVERGTGRGARQFLRTASAILEHPGHALWITPQGHFTDARQRTDRFEVGLGHLATRCPMVRFIPLAIEYTWWFERSPEILIAFGPPVSGPDADHERALADLQDRLAAASQARDPADFETLVSGRAGVGGFYDLWRRLKSRLRGESFQARHE